MCVCLCLCVPVFIILQTRRLAGAIGTSAILYIVDFLYGALVWWRHLAATHCSRMCAFMHILLVFYFISCNLKNKSITKVTDSLSFLYDLSIMQKCALETFHCV